MKKIRVMYTGETQSNAKYEYTSPVLLKKGQIYEIKTIGSLPEYSTCTLKGIEGTFNPLWFEKVDETIDRIQNSLNRERTSEVKSYNTYVAVSNEIPEIGKRLVLKRGYDGFSFALAKTSPIQEIKPMEDNIYVCKTKHSTYIVQVF